MLRIRITTEKYRRYRSSGETIWAAWRNVIPVVAVRGVRQCGFQSRAFCGARGVINDVCKRTCIFVPVVDNSYGLSIQAASDLDSWTLIKIRDYLHGKTTLIKAKELIAQKTRQYAKRQFTWQRGQMKDWKGFGDTNYLDLRKKVLSYLSKTWPSIKLS